MSSPLFLRFPRLSMLCTTWRSSDLAGTPGAPDNYILFLKKRIAQHPHHFNQLSQVTIKQPVGFSLWSHLIASESLLVWSEKPQPHLLCCCVHSGPSCPLNYHSYSSLGTITASRCQLSALLLGWRQGFSSSKSRVDWTIGWYHYRQNGYYCLDFAILGQVSIGWLALKFVWRPQGAKNFGWTRWGSSCCRRCCSSVWNTDTACQCAGLSSLLLDFSAKVPNLVVEVALRWMVQPCSFQYVYKNI